ncbi:response regulator [Natrinema ejinorense]|uniref:Response regulator n=1 Tax=Natrinema ejinorense TaxID=373386 RepID=A0A2A5QXW9_9EURY|nr:response regulator [Natrinema ejinorense]PCR91667.1 response regulator [Natrinema ejinorense]
MSPPINDAITILLIEPNPGDVRLFSESLEDANIASEIHTAADGETALDFVYQRNEHADSPRPDMILLDFQLPDVDGADILSELKAEPALRSIPVIVMTSSASEADIARSYDRHANAYVQKPIEPDEFIDLSRSFEEFWLTFVRFPADRS